MENGIFDNRTKIYFGNQMIEYCLERNLKPKSKICLIRGYSSFINTGLNKRLKKIFIKKKIKIFEIINKNHNPKIDLIYKYHKNIKKFKPNLILAVGGGSVIDVAKTIAISINCKHDVWKFCTKEKRPKFSKKLGVILTLSGSGSESSDGAVMTKKNKKLAFGDPIMRPAFSIIEPDIISSAPKKLLRIGVIDSISHVLERYFTNTKNVSCTDEVCLGLLKTLIKYGLDLKNNKFKKEFFPDLIWAQKLAHDDTAGFGRKQDWATHGIAHEIGLRTNAPHGAIIAIIFPKWIKFVNKIKPDEKFNKLQNFLLTLNFLNLKKHYTCSQIIKLYFHKILPEYKYLNDIKIFKKNYSHISINSTKINPSNTLGNFIRLNAQQIQKILAS